jgi:hypothetical protein
MWMVNEPDPRDVKHQAGRTRPPAFLLMAGVLVAACHLAAPLLAADFTVPLYSATNPPAAPLVDELPLMSQVTQHGITWGFSRPQRVGQFVNGDYYVVGEVTITNISPLPTTTNGLHGSMLNIRPNAQRSGFDSRLSSGRYDAKLRAYPPITLTPGNKLVSSRSAGSTNLAAVMRPNDRSVSPVASVSILTCVAAPLPPDAFRPSYAQGSTNIYLSRNLRRGLLPSLASVQHVPPLSEFEGYLRRPWVDSVFFNFDVPSEYMASYGRENGYVMSFAGLLLTLNFTPPQKEPLLVYLVQYGIDLYGLIEQGHSGWQAHGGHGSGRKFPILLAGMLLDQDKMKSPRASFGEDMQTIYVQEILPAGTYTQSWHTLPETVVYGGHLGLQGESTEAGWGPYEHLPPTAWKSTLGESYRRCCTSACWVGQALAARLIPGMQTAWNHPQFFQYVDRWMLRPDDPRDLAAIQNATGLGISTDFHQGQAWKVLSGGGYYAAHRTFVDEMWSAYRNRPRLNPPQRLPGGVMKLEIQNVVPGRTSLVQACTNMVSPYWFSIVTNTAFIDGFSHLDAEAANNLHRFYRIKSL